MSKRIKQVLCFGCAVWLAGLSILSSASCNIEFHKSGFLSADTYALLEEERSAGTTVYRYIAPDYSKGTFTKLLIKPVKAFPQPEATARIPMSTIYTLEQRFRELVSEGAGNHFVLTHEPGPSVMRLEMSLTGSQADDGSERIKNELLIPTGLLAASEDLEVRKLADPVELYLETRVSNSETGDLIAAEVRPITGQHLSNLKNNIRYRSDPSLNEITNGLPDVLNKVFHN